MEAFGVQSVSFLLKLACLVSKEQINTRLGWLVCRGCWGPLWPHQGLILDLCFGNSFWKQVKQVKIVNSVRLRDLSLFSVVLVCVHFRGSSARDQGSAGLLLLQEESQGWKQSRGGAQDGVSARWHQLAFQALHLWSPEEDEPVLNCSVRKEAASGGGGGGNCRRWVRKLTPSLWALR